MLRHLVEVTLSAMIGSTLATVVWMVWAREGSASIPMLLVLEFSLVTMMLTLPGTLFLKFLRRVLDENGVKPSALRLLLLAIGAVAGAGILVLIAPSLETLAIGALYGFATAAAFVAIISLIERVRSGS